MAVIAEDDEKHPNTWDADVVRTEAALAPDIWLPFNVILASKQY